MIKKLLLPLLLLSMWSTFAQTPCSLDNTFATGGKLISDGSRMGEQILIQNDGKILIACEPFGNGSAYIRRFNVDGSVDASYGTGGKITITVAEIATRITGMAMHNGNVYVCGTTTTNIGGTSTYVYAAAINNNGVLMSTFGTGGLVKFNTAPNKLYISRDICLSATGEIYIAGLKSFGELFVLKLQADGTMDTSFDTDGFSYVNTNNPDHWFEVVDMDLDKTNKIVICGKKQKANNQAPNFWNILVMRFNSNGVLDNSFANAGIGLYNSNANNFDESKKIQVTPQNDYFVCGDTYDGVDYDYTVIKIRNTGILDNTFGTGGWAIHDLEYNNEHENPLNAALMSDGRILVTGNQGSGDTVYFCMLMLKPDGTRDLAFAPAGVFKNIFDANNNSSSSGMALTADGKIVLAGYTRTCANGVCGPLYMAVARYFGAAVGSPAAIVKADFENEITLYPNPIGCNSNLQIQVAPGMQITNVAFYDLQGKIVTVNFDKAQNVLQLGEFASGNYHAGRKQYISAVHG